MPTQPRTASQVSNREALASFSSSWRGLTELQRDGWKALGEQLPSTDSLGQTVFKTGLQTFIGFNIVRSSIGEVLLADAPLPVTIEPVGVFALVATGPATPPATLGVMLSDPVTADHHLLVFASPPRSAGVSFEGDFRLFGAIEEGNDALDIATAWQAKFGTLIVGQKIFFNLVMVSDGGQSGSGVRGSVVVAI